MSDGEEAAVEIDWEERKKQARLDNLEKAREAAKKKKLEKAATIEIVPVPEPKIVERPVEIRPRRITRVQRPQAPKRKYHEVASKPAGNKFLSHLGGFLLTLGSVAITATVPIILQAFRPVAQLDGHKSHFETGAAVRDADRNGYFNDQSIFI